MKKLSLFLSLLVTLSFAVVAKAQAPTSYRVDTIDALLNITTYGSDAKLIAYVGGGTARDDGLGGLFFFDGLSTAATNVYTVYRPKTIAAANPGRWYKLPTQVANQQADITVGDQASYAWKLLDSNAANAFSVGLTSANVYMQTWGSRPLYINSSLGGNNTILNATGGNVGIGISASLAGKLHIQSTTDTWAVLSYSDTRAAGKAVAIRCLDSAGQFMGQSDWSSDGAANNASTWKLQVGNGSGAALTAITALTSGNVGIGSAAPLAKLAVNGGVHVGGDSDPGDNNLTVDGTSTLTGTVAIGGGAAIAKILSATATIDFANTAAQNDDDQTITVTGATVGSSVALGLPAAPDADSCFTAWVSAADTVTIRFNNYSSGDVDPASATYRATVTNF